jgi:hypothetical protein
MPRSSKSKRVEPARDTDVLMWCAASARCTWSAAGLGGEPKGRGPVSRQRLCCPSSARTALTRHARHVEADQPAEAAPAVQHRNVRQLLQPAAQRPSQVPDSLPDRVDSYSHTLAGRYTKPHLRVRSARHGCVEQRGGPQLLEEAALTLAAKLSS